MTHPSILTTRMLTCSNIYPIIIIIEKLGGMPGTYCWEGALSQYLAKSEVLWLFLAWLRGLCSRLCVAVWALAAGRRSYSAGLWSRALHAGTVAAACAWDSKWRAGVRVVSYHWWMWAGTDDNVGLNRHNIILERERDRLSLNRLMQLVTKTWIISRVHMCIFSLPANYGIQCIPLTNCVK